MTDTSIPETALTTFLDALDKANLRVAKQFPGDGPLRQPVHTVYGGAHLFTADAAQKLGALALRALQEHAPDAATLAGVLQSMPPDTPQDHAQATLAPKIDKSEGAVDWNQPAQTIYDKFRAFDPWPGLFTPELKLIDIAPAAGNGAAGTILAIDDDGVTVAAGEGAIRLLTVQRAGKPRVAAADLARGSGWEVGRRL